MPHVSVLIPACNEVAYIRKCLNAVFASTPLPGGARGEVLVLANGCSDGTAAAARSVPVTAGWELRVIELPECSKPGALNAGDAAARGEVLIYLDADVTVEAALIGQITAALAGNRPLYASGTPAVPRAASWVTRAYARIWLRLPFVRNGVPGFGIFAMNRPGRQRWGAWPGIISDDTLARLSFAPFERILVPARYSWPMAEGFRNLVRVRRRQNRGVAEIRALYPNLRANDGTPRIGPARLLRLLAADPAGFLIYAAVAAAVKTPLFASQVRWTRGR